ncbi:MAG: bifunctional ornithine acetyltransferase/N-acetylglutamate synthase [Myxococcales bacterium]|nr:bifunctional ornithine acetyltransferase/N-acetylglutamate synthase [Myxococcales bacterium]
MSYRCRGSRFADVASGRKEYRALDLGIIAADPPVSSAAVFTTNKAAAAPVKFSRTILKKSEGRIRGVVVNSGNANACTGRQDALDARRMARLGAEAIGPSPTKCS